MAGKGAVQQRAWWQIGGIGLEGTPANNDLVREADFVLTVGSRLTDFPTASQSLFENPDVQFASINVNGYDAQRLGATGIVGDAKRALAALAAEVAAAGFTSPAGVAGPGPLGGGELGAGAGRRAGPGHPVRPRDDPRRLPATSSRTPGRCSPRARSSA